MGAAQFLEGKLAFYEETFAGNFRRRAQQLFPQAVVGGAGAAIDVARCAQEFDPAVLKSEYEEAVHTIAEDLAATYHDALSTAANRDPVAASLVGRYELCSEQRVALKSELSQSQASLFHALGELGATRSRYLNFVAGKNHQLLLGGGRAVLTGVQLGSIVPGIGHAIGALIGAGAGLFVALDGASKQEQQLTRDYFSQLEVVHTAIARNWSGISRVVQERFRDLFGTRLQQLAADVKHERKRQHLGRGPVLMLPGTGTQRSASRRTSLAAAAVLVAGIAVGGAWFALGRHANNTTTGIRPGSVLRAGPGTNFEARATLPNGGVGQIVDQTVQGWLKLRTPDGREGWLSLDPEKLPAAPATSIAQPTGLPIAKSRKKRKTASAHSSAVTAPDGAQSSKSSPAASSTDDDVIEPYPQ